MQLSGLFNLKTVLLNGAVAIAYFLSAKSVSFLSLTEGGNVFVVWPPTGVALAALIIFGARVGAGVFIGALALNYSIVSLPLSIHIALGNAIGPLFCFYALVWLDCKRNCLQSHYNVIKFFIAILIGSLITSINGALALSVWGAMPMQRSFYVVWYAWFAGDLIGFVAITPLIVSIRLYKKELLNIKIFEFTALFAFTSIVAYVVFGSDFFGSGKNYPTAYIMLPAILWAVFRFTPPTPLFIINLISFFAIFGTAQKHGPFAAYPTHESLALLQTFIGISVVTVLLVVGVVNEREQAKKELEALNATLSQKIEEEIAKSRRHQNLLAQQSKMAAMGEMIGAIAHQWRQPLNALGIMVQDIKMAHMYDELDEKYIDEIVNRAMFQIGFMSKTIDDFRNFFKPDKSKVGFDVFSTALDAIRIVEPQFRSSGIDIKLRCFKKDDLIEPNIRDYNGECSGYLAFGYPNEFRQVVLNIMTNSRDAIVERISKRDKDKKGLLLISLQNEAGAILLTIEDNGGGISRDIGARVFEPYFTTKDQGKGTGIGLYMSKMIIENNMEGSLAFHNTKDGAAFVIKIKEIEPSV